ncbi:metal ABC transporter permease [Fibrobacter sp. UWH6]|uniref:metal ABC transporter permease n=1 Tax=Fibrobacter sp. (strain UWH6) TaxID=1896212 RepID=UPI000934A108|nr:metal ABC transporter permease [Fibrobacter sp. UWH6]
MLELLSMEFMQNALVAAVLVAVACGVMGTFVVVNRLTSLAGGVAHASFGGVGLAALLGFSPMLGSLGFAVACAMLMGILTWRDRKNSDTFIGVIWAGGMALGVILTDLTPGYSGEMMSFLFGSLLTVPLELLYWMVALLVVILVAVVVNFRKFLAISYDPEFARVQGLPVLTYYMALIALIALTVVIAVQAVGMILVIALLTIPAYIAECYAKNLAQMMVMSVVFSLVLVVTGLMLACQLNFVVGPTIIACGVLVYALHFAVKKLRRA